MKINIDSVGKYIGEELGESFIDVQNHRVIGDIGDEMEEKIVFYSGRRRRRDGRDWEMEEGSGCRKSKVVNVEEASTHFWW